MRAMLTSEEVQEMMARWLIAANKTVLWIVVRPEQKKRKPKGAPAYVTIVPNGRNLVMGGVKLAYPPVKAGEFEEKVGKYAWEINPI